MNGEGWSGIARRFWYERRARGPWWFALAGPPLSAAESLYRMGLALGDAARRARASDPLKVAAPVVSVGNLTVGGTGKTAFCLALASLAEGWGRKVAVVSHSYGREKGARAPMAFGGGEGPAPSWRLVGDEAVMMAAADPALVVVGGAGKAASLERASRTGADLLVIDDAFHRRDIHRDLDIVLIGAERGLGNKHCLPRGPLREPPEALGRADMVVVTSLEGAVPPELEAEVRRHNAAAPLIAAVKRPSGLVPRNGNDNGPMPELAGAAVFAFCALGDPGSFFAALEKSGARLAGRASFRDHHPYSGSDISRLASEAAALGAAAAVTTAKDAVKVEGWPEGAPPLMVLGMEMEIIDPGRALEEKLRRLMGA